MFKETICLRFMVVTFGNWSERYIKISILTLLGKTFNMAYSVVMLKPRPLPSYGTIKLFLARIKSVSLETKPTLKDAPFAVEHSVRV